MPSGKIKSHTVKAVVPKWTCRRSGIHTLYTLHLHVTLEKVDRCLFYLQVSQCVNASSSVSPKVASATAEKRSGGSNALKQNHHRHNHTHTATRRSLPADSLSRSRPRRPR